MTSAANDYDVGEVVESQLNIYVDNVLTDPSTLTFKYEDPASTITTQVYGVAPSVVRVGVGQYEASFTVTSAGDWFYRWVSTGTAAGAGERRVHVRPTRF